MSHLTKMKLLAKEPSICREVATLLNLVVQQDALFYHYDNPAMEHMDIYSKAHGKNGRFAINPTTGTIHGDVEMYPHSEMVAQFMQQYTKIAVQRSIQAEGGSIENVHIDEKTGDLLIYATV